MVTLGTRERHQDEQQLDGLLAVSSRRHKPSKKKMTAKQKFLHREKTPSNSAETTLNISKKIKVQKTKQTIPSDFIIPQTDRTQIRNEINKLEL